MRLAPSLFTLLLSLALIHASWAADAAPRVTYSQAQAVFVAHCMVCHDSKEADGELVMESFDLLMKGGENGAVIVPGKPDKSLLIQQIEHKKKPYMPPKKAKDTLSPAEIATIRLWIEGGAPAPAPGEIIPHAVPIVSIPKVAPKGVPRKPVRAVGWSSQADLAAVARDSEIELLHVGERDVVRRLHADKGMINTLTFSADGSKIAAGAGEGGTIGEIDVWSVADGHRIQHFEGHHDAVYSIALSPDGKLLASGSYDNRIILWDLATAKPIRTLDGHNGAILSLAFRPDSAVLASASADRTVKLWDVQSGNRLDTLSEPLKDVNAVHFTSDGSRVIAAGTDNRIREWQLGAQAREGTNHLLVSQFGHEGAILAVALSSDGKLLVSAADDRTVKLWDPAPTSASGSPELKMLRVLPAQSDWPVAVAFAREDKLLLVGRLDGTVGYYDPQSGAEVTEPKPQLLALSPRGIQQGQVTPIKIHGKHLAGVTGVSFSNAKLTAKLIPGGSSANTLATIEVTCAPDLATGAYELKLINPGGESNAMTVFVDDLPQSAEKEPNDSLERATPIALPADVWGSIDRPGDTDYLAFSANAGKTIVIDVASQRLGSKAKVLLELFDANGRLLASSSGFDAEPEPLLAFTPPADGRYFLRLTDMEAAGSESHFYRISAGPFAFVTGCYPLAAPANSTGRVQLVGLNVPSEAFGTVEARPPGTARVLIDRSRFRSRRTLTVVASAGAESVEAEPNDVPSQANPIAIPGSVSGRIDYPGDIDLFRFQAVSGRNYSIETLASRSGSPADTRIEVLYDDGRPVPRVVLRAVRDSAVTFRGFDANAGGGRLVNWKEMDINQYLYLSGEVVKLMLAPRGPDSEYGFYTIGGKRQCFFDTTATAHPLDEPCYIVEPHQPGETLSPNGLPAFTLYYANDDDADRKLGSDSRLLFTAPSDGSYLVRVTDARGAGGDRYVYRLSARLAAPDFNVSIDLRDPAIPVGSGRNFTVNLDRIDGFQGPVRVDLAGAPPGFVISSPIVVEAKHNMAQGTIYASPNAPAPSVASASLTKVTATADIDGKQISKGAAGFGRISIAAAPSLTVGLDPLGGATRPASDWDKPSEITVVPGQFTPARLWIRRNHFTDEMTFEADNLPHGVIIADIGLNGVLIAENQSERQIFLHTAPWVAEQDRLCYVRALKAGSPTSMPVMIHVRRPIQQALGRQRG